MAPREEESAIETSSSELDDFSQDVEIPPHTRNTHNGHDLEKQDTARSASTTGRNRPRVTRTQSLTRRNLRGRFTHPLQHIKTTEDQIVDFDGADDPYRPLNWPMRKKVVTTLLYG